MGYPTRRVGRQLSSAAALLALGMMFGAGSYEAKGVTPELLDKARVRGGILVMVTLRVPADASGGTIAAVKQSLVLDIAPTRHRIVRELAGLPQIVIEASADTLRALAASSRVLRVDEAVPRPPSR